MRGIMKGSLHAIVGTLAVSCLVASTSTLARAAEENPDVQACKGKSEGDACETTTLVKPEQGPLQRKSVEGTCQPDECCELDYSKGSPPATNCGPCLACKPSGPTAKGDAGDTPPVIEPDEPDAEPPRTEPGTDPPASAPQEQRGCTLGGPRPELTSVALLGLVVFGHRRRR